MGGTVVGQSSNGLELGSQTSQAVRMSDGRALSQVAPTKGALVSVGLLSPL